MKISPGDTVEFVPANGPRQLAEVISVDRREQSAIILLAGEEDRLRARRKAYFKRLTLIAEGSATDDRQ